MRKFSLLLILLLTGCPVDSNINPEPEPGPAPFSPSAEMKTIVSPVVPIEDAELAQYYSDFADVVERDSEIIKTTGQIRTANSRAGQLLFQKTGMKGKYPGLAEKIDSAIIQAIGSQNVTLSDDKRARAVEIFKALAWACQ